MLPADITDPTGISLNNPATSKKRVLEEAARLLSRTEDSPDTEQIYERLMERERLGSTGLANGVALPHARMPGVTAASGAFIRLSAPVEFDALDGKPVDLIFSLLVPEQATQEHLDLLAGLARLFSDPQLCAQLRQTQDPAEAHALLAG